LGSSEIPKRFSTLDFRPDKSTFCETRDASGAWSGADRELHSACQINERNGGPIMVSTQRWRTAAHPRRYRCSLGQFACLTLASTGGKAKNAATAAKREKRKRGARGLKFGR
jgi:hypothetical protein